MKPQRASIQTQRADTTLVEVLDRLIDRGVVLTGELTISVADVELISLQLNLLLSSVDRIAALPARSRGP